MLIIHYFSGRWQFPEDRFNMQKCWDLFVDLNLPLEKRKNYKMEDFPGIIYGSATFLVGREQEEIWRLVPEGFESRHAGRSSWVIDGIEKKNLNYYSDGIEIINDGLEEYLDWQYEAVAWLYRMYYKDKVPLKLVRGHEEIAPGRKKDPGTKWNWDKFYSMC